MQNNFLINIFSDEINSLIDQLKEELVAYFQHPYDQNLIKLIFKDLEHIESNLDYFNQKELNTLTREFHDHLYIVSHHNDLTDNSEYQSCIEELHEIEQQLVSQQSFIA